MRLARTVIVEGANGAGKTTFARELAQATGAPVEHSGGPKTTAAELLSAAQKFAAMQATIIDRFPPISQIAYDVALGRAPLVPHAELLEILDAMRPPVVVVFCHPPWKVLEEHVPAEHANHPPEHLRHLRLAKKALYLAYDELLGDLWRDGCVQLLYRYDRTRLREFDRAVWWLTDHEICAD